MNAPVSEASKSLADEKSELQLVVFTLAGCELAVEIHQVREIIRVSDITLMPKAPKFLEGIINLRGRIFPVLDFKKKFNMPLLDRTDESRILVVEAHDQILGFLVDKVVEVFKVSATAVEPVDQTILTIGPDFVKGRVAVQGRLILLFNLEKTFNLEDLEMISRKEENPLGD